ncbi:MAG: glycoside hydrolase family 28 protein [Prevotella sp.]|nr:glycoside hydrolase family 28 protein [Prevotella sp.]
MNNLCTMKKTLLTLSLLVAFITANAELIDMKKAGADATGKNVKANTQLINSTINKLAEQGGGTLFFPAGDYLTGPITLQSNITLDLEAGATLRFSDDPEMYIPMVDMRYEGVLLKSFHPLIYAMNCENITIKGEGTLDGQGKYWWNECHAAAAAMRKDGKYINKYQQMFEDANDIAHLRATTNEDWSFNLKYNFLRPPFIQPLYCKNVKIQGVHIQNSPFWTVNPQFCDNVLIDGITINNVPSPNTDGINPESCSNVHICNSHISVGDDCITIKSGRDLNGRQAGRPCENITITNCTMLAGHGGVVIGSEMSGGVKKVTISNCVFDGTDRGIRIKSTRGRGGIVEDIRVSNIVMSNIQREAFVFNLKYSKMPEEPKSERTPEFKNIFISGCTVNGVKTPIKIVGLEEAPITGISIRDVQVRNATDENIIENCHDIRISDFVINGKEFTLQ